MIPIGFSLVILAGYLASRGLDEGPWLMLIVVAGTAGAYLPFAGASLFVLALIFWFRVFYLERHGRVARGNDK